MQQERANCSRNTDRITRWMYDNKDQLRLAIRSADSGSTEILRVDPDGFKDIYSCTVFETCTAVAFDEENDKHTDDQQGRA